MSQFFNVENAKHPFSRHEVRKGDWGWFADSATKLREVVIEGYDSVNFGQVGMDPTDIDEDDFQSTEFPFVMHLGWRYFYPAPYEFMQKKWVEEVGLKVGDKVRIVKKWEKGEGGFDCDMGFLQEVNLVGYVDSIEKDSIYVALHSGPYHTPYFALEKVEEAPTTHRPFADAEEFSMYERLTLRKGDDRFVVLSYNNTGVVISSWREPENVYSNGDVVGRIVGVWESKHYPYKELLEEGFLFNSSQKPAGVKL